MIRFIILFPEPIYYQDLCDEQTGTRYRNETNPIGNIALNMLNPEILLFDSFKRSNCRPKPDRFTFLCCATSEYNIHTVLFFF